MSTAAVTSLSGVNGEGNGVKAMPASALASEDDRHLQGAGSSEAQHSSQHTAGVSSEDAENTSKEGDRDSHVVTWSSPDSPENPRNWSKWRKKSIIGVVSVYAFLSPLSSSMIAPALPLLRQDFNVTSSVVENMMLSVFILGYAIMPLLIAPLSEVYGRKNLLQSCNAFFLLFTLICGFAQSAPQLIVFRLLAGLGGSAPLALGAGTIADLYAPEERGVAVSSYTLLTLLGPAVGPIMGGWIIQSLDRADRWRWIFWITAMFGSVVALVGLCIYPETYAPRILQLKRMRIEKETGQDDLVTIFEKERGREGLRVRLKRNLTRPFLMLGTKPIVQILALYMAIVYACIYLVYTTYTTVFTQIYGESIGIASLNYISLALGYTIGGQIGGRTVDKIYRRLKARNGGVGRPEFKLPLMMVSCFIFPTGFLVYGWSAQYHVHWIVPNIGAVLLALGTRGIFLSIQAYLIDTFELYAASALSAATFLRSVGAFAFPLFASALYAALGLGWGNSLLALITALIGIPAPFLLWKYGPRLRATSFGKTSGLPK